MYYQTNNQADENARLCLALFPRDLVEDIVDLVLKRGRAVISDSQDESANMVPSKVFGILSSDFVPTHDFPKVLVGYSAVAISGLSTFRGDAEGYANTLVNAFGIPTPMAKRIASNLETSDPMFDPNASGVENWTSEAMDAFRRMLNVPGSALGFEYDADQDFDLDFLYELGMLGDEIAKLNSRANLVKGQAAAMLTGIWSFGQIGKDAVYKTAGDAFGDVEDGDVSLVTDLIRNSPTRRLPLKAFGKAASISAAAQAGRSKAMHDLSNTRGPSKMADLLTKAIAKIKANPGKAIALATGVGLAPFAIKAIAKKLMANKLKGDSFELAYGDVSDEYGDTIADAWAKGDIDAIVGDAMLSANEELTTGDSVLDDEAYGDALESAGDVFGDAGDSEIGGLFTKWRTNAAIKKANRSNARGVRRSDRQASRLDSKQNRLDTRLNRRSDRAQRLADARAARAESGIIDAYPTSRIGQDEIDMMPEPVQEGYGYDVNDASQVMEDNNNPAYDIESFDE